MASKKSPDKKEFADEYVLSNSVHVDRDSYGRRDVQWLKMKLNQKYKEVLKGIEFQGSFVAIVEQASEVFPNPFIRAIAEKIAEISDMGDEISGEEIANKLKVDPKHVFNKIPFVRTVLEMIGITIASRFKERKPEDIKRGQEVHLPVYHRLEKI